MKCPSCSRDSPEGMKFCGYCGSELAPAPPDQAELRQVTVLFCDLAGSTSLSERLDPEEYREVIRAYQQTSSSVVDRYGGHVAQYLGDGILVYFGYPRAQEDDAQRAVRAALEIPAAMEPLGDRLRLPISVRLGIHTGPVVAGEVGASGRREQLALGQTPNIAARLQALAYPDAVIVSGATHHLIEGYFEASPLGPRTLKGVSEPIEVFEIVGDRALESRFAVTASQGLRSLVGRAQEKRLLEAELARALGGEARSALLIGDPGIGKSRLVHAVREDAEAAEAGWMLAQCSSFTSNTALHPIVETLRPFLDVDPRDAAQAQLAHLQRRLAVVDMDRPEVVSLLAPLLLIPETAGYEMPAASPQRTRELALGSVVELLRRLSRDKPLVLAVEDLHWVDATTLELLSLLVDTTPVPGVFVLLTTRPELDNPWPETAGLTLLPLGPLPADAVESLVTGVTGGKGLPEEVLRLVVDKTDGVPLFVEELTRMLVESGRLREGEHRYELQGSLDQLNVPDTLQASLVARLDRYPGAREIAQLGAVIGRSFSYEMLRLISDLDDDELQADLHQLMEAELLFQTGTPPDATYLFKHALVQDVAYGMLLRRSRRNIHERVATALVHHFPATTAAQPEVVAHHYTEAQLPAQAVPLWLQAGELANARSAHIEAAGHLRRGLELLSELGDPRERDRLELAFQIQLGTAVITSQGYGLPEVETIYSRAQELVETGSEGREQFWISIGLILHYFVRAELSRSLKLADRMVVLAESLGQPDLTSVVNQHRGMVLFFMGRFAEALASFDAVATDDNPEYTARTGSGIGVTRAVFKAMTCWHLGRTREALELSSDGVAQARESGIPYTLVVALIFAAQVRRFIGDREGTAEMAEELIRICEDQGFPLWQHQGILFREWARAGGEGTALPPHDEISAVVDLTGQAVGFLLGSGALLAVHFFCATRAETLAALGRRQEALEEVERGLELTSSTGDRFWEADLLRLKGELTTGAPSAAVQLTEAALATARRLGSVSLELRAAVALARLHVAAGREREARDLLAAVVPQVDAGFASPDLSAAKRLLVETQRSA